MCGICGEVSFAGRPVDPSAIQAMNDSQRHRGPDDDGLFCEGPVGLGHRRLSIIDLSAAGRQPMWTADRRMAIVFNGEVYNFAEIRQELLARGYRFASGTDSEVVLNAVHCWGIEAAVAKFIGMFAFAIWDAVERCLYLCRDRPGVKPLYYHRSADSLIFASELKAIVSHPLFRRELDTGGIAQFFVVGYTLGESSVFRDTYKLLPGHYLKVASDGTVTRHGYWSLDGIERGGFRGSFDEAADRLSELLDSAFRYRLVADVPVGLFLSGGVDSSLLAAFLKHRLGQDLLHVTIGFREPRVDEAEKAASVARQLGVRHVVEYVEAPDARDALERFTAIYDEPFGDTSGIPTSILSRVARQHVKVALSADGGDEQFCGYDAYVTYARHFDWTSRLPRFVRRALPAVLGRLVPYRLVLSAAVAARNDGFRHPQLIARYEKLLDVARTARPADLIRVMNEKAWTMGTVSDLLRVTASDAFGKTVLFAPGLDVARDAMLDAMMRTDYTAFLRDDILTKVDRASMAVSLECRDPFLDHRIAEFAFSLPLDYVYDGREHKRILKHLLRRWVDERTVSAPKRGFSIPLYEWLRGPWKSMVHDALAPSRLRAVGVLDERVVAREVDRFYRYQGCRAERLMTLLLFQLWAEKWYLQPARAAA